LGAVRRKNGLNLRKEKKESGAGKKKDREKKEKLIPERQGKRGELTLTAKLGFRTDDPV